MLKIKLVTIGTIKEGYLKDAICEYAKRLSAFVKLEMVELPEVKESSKLQISQVVEAEGKQILEKLEGYVVVLDLKGKELTSPELAELIRAKSVDGVSKMTFVVGGSYGLSPDVIRRADYSLCFSKLTFPHQLIRVNLLEQIYRAETIINNIKYHK